MLLTNVFLVTRPKGKYLLLLTLLCGTADADYLFINIGAGNNTNLTGASIEWDDAGGIGCTITAGYANPISKNLILGARWLHISQCDQGPPINDNPESSVDHIGVFLEYRIDI